MFILLDKPAGWTSHDLVDKVRRLYPDEKVGHGGTLDPYATGLLVIAVGKDTKQLDRLLGAKKTYITTIDFSRSTDTRDMQYRKEYTQRPIDHATQTIIVEGEHIQFPSPEQCTSLLDSSVGTHLFPLTPFSAKKIEGKKLYEYARAGAPIFMDIPMTVYAYRILDITFPEITIEYTVGGGTYIRSLGYWLGKQFGLGGTLTMLRRTKVGTLCVPEKK